MGAFKDAHGGQLRNLYLDADAAEAAKRGSGGRKSWDLTERQLCDLELLMNGGFSPLEGFLGRADYESVLAEMRLASGLLWPIPITLDVTPAFAEQLELGETIDLRDREGVLNATMTVTDRWQPDKAAEALAVFGSDDSAHPAVRYLHDHAGSVYLGGPVQGIEAPTHYDFKHLRDTPQELRDRFRKLGWRRVIAFQTRNPMHRAHQELTFRAAQAAEANLLLQPVVGMTKPGDVDHFTRVRCYEKLLHHYPEQTTTLSLLPLAMRMAGPREAVWHAIIRKNYGCTHLIVGRDHAGPGNDSAGKPFYGPYAAQELFAAAPGRARHHHGAVPEPGLLRDPRAVRARGHRSSRASRCSRSPAPSCAAGCRRGSRSPNGSRSRRWSRSCAAPTRRATRQGFTVFFTGLSGSGKSTIANALVVKLLELGGRPVTLLDGDHVRKHLSSELGFSREHRDLNILRIAYVASEITRNGGIAVCAPIAPYAATRAQGARHDRAHGRLPRDPRRDLARGLRGAATARASTPRPAPASSRSSPASPTRTRRRRTRRCGSTRRR